MQSCPNISSPEWRKLVSVVGEMEAYRDYMTYGDIRDITSVLVSINSRTPEVNAQIQGATSIIESSLVSLNNALAGAGLLKFADDLASRLGISYEMINAEEAANILSSADQTYNNEPAFFYQGSAYFVSERVNKDMVLHEFAHPLVRSIKKDNPELFEKLYQEALSFPGITNIIEEKYSDQSIESQQEEAIVRAMEMAEPKSGFWKRLAYAFKQLLRKIFGSQVKTAALSKDTTLADLFEMLKTERFNIDFVDSSNENVVAFIREQEEINDFLANEASSPEIEDLLVNLQKVVNHSERLVDNEQVNKAIGEFLETEDGAYIFEELARELGKFKQYNNEAEKYIKNEKPMPADLASLVITRNLAVLSNTVGQLNVLVNNLEQASFKLSKDPDQAQLIETQAIFKIVQAIQIWTGSLTSLMKNNDVPSDNDFRISVGRIEFTARDIESQIRKVFKAFSVDFIYEETSEIRKTLQDYYDNTLAQLNKEKKAGKKVDKEIAKFKKSFKDKLLTKSNLDKILSGELGDASIASSMMENFLNNPDPVIGGFATWYRKQSYKAQGRMQSQTNDFLKTILPILKDAGYTASNPQKFFNQLLFLDKTVRRTSEFDETLETNLMDLEEYEVQTLLNPYKNYLADKKLLEEKIEKAQATDNITELADLYQQRDQMNEFFHRRYTEEYYNAFEEYKSPVGKSARVKLDGLYDSLRQIDEKISGYNQEDITDEDFIEKKLILREIRQLYSEVDLLGKKKTGESLEIAQLLKSVGEKTRDFYEFKEIPGLFNTAYTNFLNSIQHVEFGSEEYNTLIEDWLETNSQVAVTDEYFDSLQTILDEIESIQKSLNMESPSLKKMYETINDITKGFKDSANETEAEAITAEAQKKARDIQQQILDYRSEMTKLSGLTQTESDRLTELLSIKNSEGASTEELAEIRELFDKKKALGVDPTLVKRLYSLYAALSEMRQTEPTQYYIDAISSQLSRIKSEDTVPSLFQGAFPEAEKLLLTTGDVKVLMTNPAFLNTILQDKEFSAWYNRNHVYNQKKKSWERSMLWNVKKPSNDRFYKTTVLPTGDEIKRIPNRSYQERIVKDKYITDRVVNKTVDVWGNFLPNLNVENNPYRNDEYFKLKKENPSMFKALEALTDWHLSKQEDLNRAGKLGYQIPRFRPDTLERAQELSKRGSAGALVSDVKEKFLKTVDDIQEGYNFDQRMLATFGIVDDDLAQIPIHGVAKLDSNAVSLNVLDSILRYNSSAIYQEMLIETSPIAKMIIDTIDDDKNRIKDRNTLDRQIFKRTGRAVSKAYSNKVSRYDSVRSTALNAFYEREYLGKVHAETLIDRSGKRTQQAYRFLQKGTGSVMKLASTTFFAVNIPSALKNRFAAVLQNNIEASAGEVLTPQGFLKGKVDAKKAIAQVSSTIYESGARGKYVQIGQIFDIDGQLNKQRGAVSRTFSRDAVSMSWLFSPRKLLQMDGTLELLYGMMHSKTIELKDGSKITLADAMQMKNGQLEVRPDTKEDWSISSDNFVKFRILFQGKMNRLQGTYDQIDQPMFTRYLAGRMMIFLRKYFISMFMHRFANHRVQYDTVQMEQGYYRSGGKFIYNFLKALQESSTHGGTFADFNRNTAKEKNGFKRMTADMIQQVVLMTAAQMMMKLMFNYDPESDDEDDRKTARLRKVSGSLPLPFTDSKYKFNPVGYFQLHMLNQMIQVHQEAATFTPMDANFNSPGLRSIGEMIQSPVSAIWTPTVARGGKIFTGIQATAKGKRSAEYTRDVGPWLWQKEGSNKAAAETLKFIGLNGKTVDPANAIVQWQQGQRLRTR